MALSQDTIMAFDGRSDSNEPQMNPEGSFKRDVIEGGECREYPKLVTIGDIGGGGGQIVTSPLKQW